jgi:hypothetical protein
MMVAWLLNAYESVINKIRGKGFFPHWHVWDLRSAIAFFIVPRLKAFRDMYLKHENVGVPKEFANGREAEWISVLDGIIFAFEYELDSEAGGADAEKNARRQAEGLHNFAKYYLNLWD